MPKQIRSLQRPSITLPEVRVNNTSEMRRHPSSQFDPDPANSPSNPVGEVGSDQNCILTRNGRKAESEHLFNFLRRFSVSLQA